MMICLRFEPLAALWITLSLDAVLVGLSMTYVVGALILT